MRIPVTLRVRQARVGSLLAAVLLASTLLHRDCVAQQVDAGSIVRFRPIVDGDFRTGNLSRLSKDSIILDSCYRCSVLRYNRNEIVDFEVYRGSTYGRNMLFGFLGGAVGAGAIAGAIVGSQSCSGDLCGLRYMAIPFATLAGGVTGLLIGIARSKEIWDPVPQLPAGSEGVQAHL